MIYFWSILLEIDVFACVILAPLFRRLGVTPVQGMRLSDVFALAMRNGRQWGCVACKVLDWFSKDHCQQSLASLDAEVEAIEKATGQS